MPNFEIWPRYRNANSTPRFSGNYPTRRACILAAIAAKVDLSGSDLSGSDLSGSNLCWSNLRWSVLNGSNLRGSDLSGSDLSGSDLSGSNLSWSNLRGSNLSGSNLSGSRINWRSHDLIAEILRRAAGDDIKKLKIAGVLLVRRDWCWTTFWPRLYRSDRALLPWFLETMKPFYDTSIAAGDAVPELVVKAYDRAAKTKTANKTKPKAKK